jgi:hypothetical protein
MSIRSRFITPWHNTYYTRRSNYCTEPKWPTLFDVRERLFLLLGKRDFNLWGNSFRLS